MPAAREMLEGEAYWGRIRMIKRRLFILEAILIAVLGAVLIFLSREFQTNPFYIPFDRLLWFIAIMLLVVEIEEFVFRIMQVRIAKSCSTKHIMTINSMRRALVIVIVAAVVAILFSVSTVVQGVEDAFTFNGEVTPDSPQRLLPGDPIGLSRVATISIHTDIQAEIYLVPKPQYDLYKDNWPALKGSALNNNTIANPDLTIVMSNISYMYIYLLIDPSSSILGNLSVASYSMEMRLSSTLTVFVPLIAIVFVIANAAWIAYLLPLSRKYACGSIYK